MFDDDAISDQTRELPEVQLPVIVYFHTADADDQAEVRNQIEQIRHVIQVALADEDNDLAGFVYPEVRLDPPYLNGRFGAPGRNLDV